MACPLERVGPGRELQFAVRHIGHFELARILEPSLNRAPVARLVALSFCGP